jgi:hypothetical protein
LQREQLHPNETSPGPSPRGATTATPLPRAAVNTLLGAQPGETKMPPGAGNGPMLRGGALGRAGVRAARSVWWSAPVSAYGFTTKVAAAQAAP